MQNIGCILENAESNMAKVPDDVVPLVGSSLKLRLVS